MGSTYEQAANAADPTLSACDQARSTATELAGGNWQAVRTGETSGARSSTGSGPVPTRTRGSAGSALDTLTGDLQGDAVIVERFVSDYLSLLPGRMTGLRRLVATHASAETVRLAILSLETTSAMLGAAEVVASARALRAAVSERSAEPAVAAEPSGTPTIEELLARLEVTVSELSLSFAEGTYAPIAGALG